MTFSEIRNLPNDQRDKLKLSDLLTVKQKEAYRLLKDKGTIEILYGGAAGGGKSALLVIWLIFSCLMFPGTRWLLGRSKLKTLKETTLNTFFDIAGALGYTDHYNYNQQSGIIKWSNGSQIILKDLFSYPSDPNFESLGSLEITGAAIDECSEVSHKAVEIVRSRIRYKLDDFDLTPKILMTTNPKKNWVYTVFYKPWKNKKLPKFRAFVRALVTDNPFLPESYIESLRNLSDLVTKERLLHGNFEYDDDPAKLMEYDAIMDIFNNEHVGMVGNMYMTVDVATRGSDVFRISIWKGLTIIEDVEIPKSNGPEVVAAIRKAKIAHKVPNSFIVFDADGVGSMVDGFFPGARMFINGAKPIGKEKYENRKTQCYFRLAEYVNDRKIWIKKKKTEDQKDFIAEELGQIKRRDVDDDLKLKLVKKEDIKTNIGRSPDYADTMMMRMLFELKGQKGYDPFSHAN